MILVSKNYQPSDRRSVFKQKRSGINSAPVDGALFLRTLENLFDKEKSYYFIPLLGGCGNLCLTPSPESLTTVIMNKQ